MHFSGTNFQSWREFDIDIDGLTIVMGGSDIGKSAIFRALKGMLRNDIPVEWIRTGTDEMELKLEHAGRLFIMRRHRKKATEYEIDGQVYAKLNGAVPDALRALRFNDVVVGDADVDPIFGRQNSPQFMIDPEAFKPAHVNAILGMFGGTEKLEAGKKEANLRKTQKDSEARTIAGQIRDGEERKAALIALQAQGANIAGALRAMEQEVRLLEPIIRWSDTASQIVQRIKPFELSLDDVIETYNAVVSNWKQVKLLTELIELNVVLPALAERLAEYDELLATARAALDTAKAQIAVVEVKAEAVKMVEQMLCPKCKKPLNHICTN